MFKAELYRNPVVLAANGGPWKGLGDLEAATAPWVAWYNTNRLHGALNHATPVEVEAAHYHTQAQAPAA